LGYGFINTCSGFFLFLQKGQQNGLFHFAVSSGDPPQPASNLLDASERDRRRGVLSMHAPIHAIVPLSLTQPSDKLTAHCARTFVAIDAELIIASCVAIDAELPSWR
jgi:hypothetical protein